MAKSKWFQEVERVHQETAELQKQTEAELQKLSRQVEKIFGETDEYHQQTHREIQTLSREVGKITDGWGKFVEALVQPAFPGLFKSLGIKRTFFEATSRKNGQTMEIDVLGVGERAVVACSVKSRLQVSDVKEFMLRVPRFFVFFPEYRDKKVFGAVAGIRLDEGVAEYAQKKGLYVIGSSGSAVKLLNKKSFKPKVWQS